MTSTGPAILVEDLVKVYGETRAVDGLSFSVERGEIFALLGPNGAGKSTTVEILEGYRRPDTGTVRVLGLDPMTDATRLKSQVGVMLQEGGLYLTMTAREAVHLFARFYPAPNDPDETLALVGLQSAANTRYRRLSGGQKQRLSLALALIGRPQMVFLDEATAGMDPQARRLTWNLIRSLRDSGVTVLFTTHYLEEAERLADRVAIIDAGRTLRIGTPAELASVQSGEVRLRAARGVDVAVFQAVPSARLSTSDGEGLYTFITSDPPQTLVDLATLMRDERIAVLELRVGSGSLEELFLRLTGDELRG